MSVEMELKSWSSRSSPLAAADAVQSCSSPGAQTRTRVQARGLVQVQVE